LGEKRGVYRILVGKPEGKRTLGRPRRRWEDKIRMDLQEVGCGGIHLDLIRRREVNSFSLAVHIAVWPGSFIASSPIATTLKGIWRPGNDPMSQF
jgi:hypothetical protein